MNSKRFAEIYEGLTSKEAALFGVKKGQYAFDDERLHNFIQAAKVEGKRPSQVAFSYFTKHLIAIQKAIETEGYELYWERITDAGDKDECIVQRFADARNYLLLMLCCLEHEAQEPISFGAKPAPTTREPLSLEPRDGVAEVYKHPQVGSQVIRYSQYEAATEEVD